MLTDVNERELVELPADITPLTVEAFRQSTARALTGEPEVLLLDCSQISYMSSTHVGLIWGTYIDCERRSVRMQLVHVSDQIRIVLRTLDLDTILLTDADITQPIAISDEPPAAITVSQSFEDHIRLAKEDIQQGLERFVEFLQTLGVGSATIFELRLIYYEVVMNVKFHSGLTKKDMVEFSAEASSTGITMIFGDRGTHFDPTAAEITITPEEAARSGKVRGFGLAMINRIVKSISYAYEDDMTNRLTIVKKWGKNK